MACATKSGRPSEIPQSNESGCHRSAAMVVANRIPQLTVIGHRSARPTNPVGTPTVVGPSRAGAYTRRMRKLILVPLLLVTVASAGRRKRHTGFDWKGLDPACKPGDDFWRYANGGGSMPTPSRRIDRDGDRGRCCARAAT